MSTIDKNQEALNLLPRVPLVFLAWMYFAYLVMTLIAAAALTANNVEQVFSPLVYVTLITAMPVAAGFALWALRGDWVALLRKHDGPVEAAFLLTASAAHMLVLAISTTPEVKLEAMHQLEYMDIFMAVLALAFHAVVGWKERLGALRQRRL